MTAPAARKTVGKFAALARHLRGNLPNIDKGPVAAHPDAGMDVDDAGQGTGVPVAAIVAT